MQPVMLLCTGGDITACSSHTMMGKVKRVHQSLQHLVVALHPDYLLLYCQA